jgi:hypothetical protein
VIKAAVICAVWTFTFLLLLAVGGLLSWASPRVCGRVPSPPNSPAQEGDAREEGAPASETAASVVGMREPPR